MELIDKAEVVTEIDKIINEANYVPFTDEVLGKLTACKKIKNFINILEVKEVDLDRAIDKWIDDAAITHEDCSITDVISTAKHFFKLGIKSKGE